MKKIKFSLNLTTVFSILIIFSCLYCAQVALATSFTYTYDTATPSGTESPHVLDDHHRLTKASLQERLAVEHNFAKTGTEVSAANTGTHTAITCDSVTSTGAISGTTISGSGNLVINTDKFTVTAASGNTMVAGTLDVTGAFESTGVATLADASLTKTSAAPTTDAMIANKKYVDDQIAAIQDPTYSGGESHTFDGGLIFKQGTKAYSPASTQTVNFGTAFPTAVVSASISLKHSFAAAIWPVLSTLSTTQIIWKTSSGSGTTVHWQAWGY